MAKNMNIYVYSDESGVFDHVHNDYYIFGGLIFIGENDKNDWNKKYADIERTFLNNNTNFNREIKSTTVPNDVKNDIFRSFNVCYKFGCVIDEHKVNENIWKSKKNKQRYLDYAYKMSIKNAFVFLMNNDVFKEKEITHINFYVDEHSTATNGIYELKESLEQEFKYGTYSNNYSAYFPPIFSNLIDVNVEFCDSSVPKKRLVRAADFVANKIYYLVTSNKSDKLNNIQNLIIKYLP
ncbi:MAG: DUF3800 domain-containing protein [Erysipelotrichaceae bacterium]|nr:DUF3800 domain-containing protein [Erysipelotrichaceae bacterium]